MFRLVSAVWTNAVDVLPAVVHRQAAVGFAQFHIVRNTTASRVGHADVPASATIRAEPAIQTRLLAGADVAGNLLAIHRRAVTARATRTGWQASIGTQLVTVRAAELLQITNTRTAGAVATLRGSDAAGRPTDRARRTSALRAIPDLTPRAGRRSRRRRRPARGFGVRSDARQADRERATETEQPLDETSPIEPIRNRFRQRIEPSIVHNLSPALDSLVKMWHRE